MIKVAFQKSFGTVKLDVDFETPEGVTAIFGRSGAGKTSVINAIAGLLHPDAGEIAIGDRVLFSSRNRYAIPAAKRKIGYVFQDARLFPHMTVAQNLHYGGTHDADRIIAVLGIGPLLKRMPTALSGGEKQRVALGRALMANPTLLLLDEPLAALDAARKAEVLSYLRELRDLTGVPMLYVSHDMTEIARIATNIVVLEDGQAIANGPLGAVLSDPEMLPHLGAQTSGAMLDGTIRARLLDDDMTEVRFSGGRIFLQGQVGRIGDTLRLHIASRDVILSRKKPEGLSALNIVATRVRRVDQLGKGGVSVQLQAGQDTILSQITHHSARRMALRPEDDVYAIIKATALATLRRDTPHFKPPNHQ